MIYKLVILILIFALSIISSKITLKILNKVFEPAKRGIPVFKPSQLSAVVFLTFIAGIVYTIHTKEQRYQKSGVSKDLT